MSTLTLSQENLQRGMNVFQSQRGWPRDFHNTFYRDLQALTSSPMTSETWHELINHLSAWRALRPFSKKRMYDSGLQYLDELNHNLQLLDVLPAASIESLAWNVAAPLFECAAQIKPVSSPVFASKLCHFLRPNLYPVVDQAVLGIGNASYAAYWLDCQAAWCAYPEPEILVTILREAIGEDVFAAYPWATKIVELCTIGAKH